MTWEKEARSNDTDEACGMWRALVKWEQDTRLRLGCTSLDSTLSTVLL